MRARRHGMLPAALAVLAMVVQLLIPVASLAAELRADQTYVAVICTADGAVERAVPASPEHHKGFAGLQCHSCVMASVAAVAPSDPVALPIRYAVRQDVSAPTQARPQARSRAPPRPPSTAPPSLLNA